MAQNAASDTTESSSPVRSLIAVAVCILLGAGLAAAGSAGGLQAGPVSAFALGVVVAFAINWIAYVPAVINRTERFYDLTGTASFLAVALVGLMYGNGSVRAFALAAMVAIWTLRLGVFLFSRIRAEGSDTRFDAIKTDPARFLLTWTLQGLWVAITIGAALAAMTATDPPGADVWLVLGAAVWLAGFAIEAVADAQKRRFRADPANEGRFIDTGLWAWSRHPNYFGEILLWIGVAIAAAPALRGWQLVTLVSPVFVTLLLTRVSGIPMLEARGLRRWGDDPAYRRHVAQTPVLIPRPPRRTG